MAMGRSRGARPPAAGKARVSISDCVTYCFPVPAQEGSSRADDEPSAPAPSTIGSRTAASTAATLVRCSHRVDHERARGSAADHADPRRPARTTGIAPAAGPTSPRQTVTVPPGRPAQVVGTPDFVDGGSALLHRPYRTEEWAPVRGAWWRHTVGMIWLLPFYSVIASARCGSGRAGSRSAGGRCGRRR